MSSIQSLEWELAKFAALQKRYAAIGALDPESRQVLANILYRQFKGRGVRTLRSATAWKLDGKASKVAAIALSAQADRCRELVATLRGQDDQTALEQVLARYCWQLRKGHSPVTEE